MKRLTTLLIIVWSAALGAQGLRPDPKLTPGATVAVTVAQICTPGYSATVRNVPQKIKVLVFFEYKIPQSGRYEVDHLISLELGGSNSILNLWPQTYALPYGAHQKDNLENYLHRQVCSGKMSLADAQHDIAMDWIAAYQKAGLK